MNKRFYYDVVCPYAYIAFSFLYRNCVFSRHNIEPKPILLGGLFKHLDTPVDPNKNLSVKKARYQKIDIARQAQLFDVPLSVHPRHPVSTVNAMRLIHSAAEDKRLLVTDKLFRAYWNDNLDIDDDHVLKKIAHEILGSDANFLSDTAKNSLRMATEDAFNHKVFGVPTLEHNERLYFGGDRLELLDEDLSLNVPKSAWPKTRTTIDFYFDFSSPYSYLAWAELKEAMAAGVQFALKPILLGALFRSQEITNIPMLAAHPHKARYYLQDMKDWAKHRNVPFTFNAHFPLKTVTALRCALVDEKLVDIIYDAAWAQNLDISSTPVLSKVMSDRGFDAHKILAKTENNFIKEQLRANTDEAFNKGVFGLPSFFVNDHLVFGQDRFLVIKQLLRER